MDNPAQRINDFVRRITGRVEQKDCYRKRYDRRQYRGVGLNVAYFCQGQRNLLFVKRFSSRTDWFALICGLTNEATDKSIALVIFDVQIWG